ncbi:MAG: hypothetical protein ACRD0U_16295 [Acidimicrobiales bacterium]
MTSRGLVCLALVSVVTLAACGDDGTAGGQGAPPPTTGGRPPASEQPRDEEIRSTIDAVWAAAGVDIEAVDVFEYGYTFAPDNTACGNLARDDRWFGERGSFLGSRLVERLEVESSIVGFLDGEGFTVERYRSTHPSAGLRAFRAVRDQLVVYGDLRSDGATDINVRSGPCAPSFTTFDPFLKQIETPDESARSRLLEQPRDDELRVTLDAVWAATGVDPPTVSFAGYGYTSAPDDPGCAALDPADRWFGDRGSSLDPGVADQATIESGILGYLASEGFAVDRFRPAKFDRGDRAFRGVRGDVVVYGAVDANGRTFVIARAGPCAPTFRSLDPDIWEPAT